MHVYVLVHERALPQGGEDTKIVGVFSSKELGEDAMTLAKAREGFRDHPDGFHLDLMVVDKTYWEEGFITVPG
ncbi:MAG: hypothetical protein H6740_08545 [Alphaproteobacteria bacterium]|nr:hypothetical protein [Alphaproteobacteria bacterium]